MNKQLKIIVQTPDLVHAGQYKELFRNVITVNDDLIYDYQSLIGCFSLLFPNKQLIINLTIS